MDFRPETASLEVFFVYVTQFPHALFEIEVAVVLLSLIPCLGCLHSLGCLKLSSLATQSICVICSQIFCRIALNFHLQSVILYQTRRTVAHFHYVGLLTGSVAH